MKIIHLSDIHFTSFPKSVRDYFSKRCLAYGNIFLNPSRKPKTEHLESLSTFIQDTSPDYLIITGDFTTTGTKEEFKKAEEWLCFLKDIEITPLILPGNHDVYVERKRDSGFFPFMEKFCSKESTNQLFDIRFITYPLNEEWLFVGMDNSQPNPWGKSNGYFDEAHAKQLSKFLSYNSEKKILLSSHYPWHKTKSKKNDLVGAERLKELLKAHSQVKLYLHGHTHLPHLLDGRGQGLPLSFETGPSCLAETSAASVIEFSEESLKIESFKASSSENKWIQSGQSYQFST